MAGVQEEVVIASVSDSFDEEEQVGPAILDATFPLQPTFPIATAERIYQGLSSQAAAFNMDDLLSCMAAAYDVLEDENMSSEKDKKDTKSFIFDLLRHVYTRLMSDDYLSYAAPRAHQVYQAAHSLVKLTALLGLKCQEAIHAASDVGRDASINHMSVAMYALSQVLDACMCRFRTLQQLISQQEEADSSEAETLPAAEFWHAILVREFVDAGGMQTCIQVLDVPTLYPMYVLESAMTLISRASCALAELPEVCQNLSMALDRFAAFLDRCIEHDQDRLSESGRDRTFSVFSRILDCLYVASKDLTMCASDADTQIRELQRHFVVEMLKSASFNKLLSAARECLSMLRRSANLKGVDKGSSLKANALWLDKGSIVKQMLRANLHQRQYADLIFHILQVLSDAKLVRAEHLDMLWATTEQEGTHDEIKVNVYQMIESLANSLSQPHLDLLFTKFQGRKGRSLSDTLRLLDLLRKLAKNDHKVQEACMAERLLDMLWQLTMSADAPPEVLQSNVITDVLIQYRNQGLLETYLARCVDQLRSKQSIYTALHVMSISMSHCTNIELRNELIGKLGKRYHIHQLLVESLRDFMHTAARWVAERAAASSQLQLPRPPGQGCYSYQQIIQQFSTCIRFFADISAGYYPQHLAEQLWDLMVLQPVQPEDFELGIQFILSKEPVPGVRDYLDHRTCAALLTSRIMALNSESLSPLSWECFWQCFVEVNTGDPESPRMHKPAVTPGGHNSQRPPIVGQGQMSRLDGLPYLWNVALTSARPDVCNDAKNKLLQLYQCAAEENASAMFISECMSRLMLLVPVLTGADGGAGPTMDLAKRSTHRLLCLLTTKLEQDQGRTMPPVLSHRSSFKGQQMVLDVQAHGVARIKLPCHANEYVGMVRRRLAEQLGCEPQRLRLFLFGDEWRSDTPLLSQAIQKLSGRQTSVIATSGNDNGFTLPPPGFAEDWHKNSTTSMLSTVNGVYDALFLLADLPAALDVRQEAVKVLQLLPTSTSIPAALQQALNQGQGQGGVHDSLRALLLGPAGEVLQPAKLLYTLQALHGLLFPLLTSTEGDSDTPMAASDQTRPARPLPSCGPGVAAGCIPLLTEVLDKVQAHQGLDVTFMRELYAVLTHVVSNMVGSHLELQQQAEAARQALDEGTGATGTPSSSAPVMVLSSIPELVAMAPASSVVAPASSVVAPVSSVAAPASSVVAPATSVAAPAAASSQQGRGVDIAMTITIPQLDSTDADVPMDACGTPLVHQCQALALGTPILGQARPMEFAEDKAPASAEQLLEAEQKQDALASAAAASSPAAGEAAAADPPPLLAPELLGTVVSLLIRFALHVGQLSQLPGSLRDMDAFTDVQLVRECLTCLSRLLRRHPELYDAFLTDDRSEDMVKFTLLNSRLGQMQECAHELLKCICLKSAGPNSCVWLLRLLAQLSHNLQAPAWATSPFFSLFKEAVTSMPEGDGAAADLAATILQEEVSSLYTTSDVLMAPNNQTLLEGKLRLVRELVRMLDKVTIGSSGSEQGLVQLLLRRYLFPEAATLARPDVSFVDMEVALERCCSETSCRKAAMDLVVDLMTPSAANMEEGLTALFEIHFKSGPITINKADIQALENMRVPNSYVGLRNGGATCYMNAVLQQLFMQPRIRELVLGAGLVPAEEQADSMFHQLQVLFAHLCFGKVSNHHPRHFWQSFKDYDGIAVDIKEHQDAYEFFTRLQDCVDQHLRCSGQTPAMQHVMGGSFAQQIICKDVDYRSEREEEFYQISVDVKGKGFLEKSLESYVQGELMEGENAYFCEEAGRRVTALKRTCIKELPQTLVIHLKRFEYDHINMQRYKVRERFEFPITLDMFRYTADGLEALEGSTAQVAAITEAQRQQGVEAKPRNYYIYELKGMVVHSGTAFAGHYYSFIKERPKVMADGQVVDGKWFHFDDKLVREWSLEHLDEDCYGGSSGQQGQERPHSAYMLFYERKDSTCFESKGVKMPVGSPHHAAAVLQQAAAVATACSPDLASDPLADAVMTPYGMPVEVYEAVRRASLQLMLKLHVEGAEYDRFIRQLVDGRGDAGRAGRKSRRRKAHWLPSVPSGGASASSGDVTPEHSALSPGASPMNTAGDGPQSATTGGPSSWAGTPSQRSEEQELANCQSMRLAMLYVISVLLASSSKQPQDASAWWDVIEGLMRRGPRPCMALLQVLLDCPGCMRFYLHSRWSEMALSMLQDTLKGALRSLNEHYKNTAAGEEGQASAMWNQVIGLQRDLFLMLHNFSVTTTLTTRSHPYSNDIKHVYILMRDMLRIAVPGSLVAMQSDVLPHAVSVLANVLELQSIKDTNRYFCDILALFGFIYQVLECIDVQLLPLLMPAAWAEAKPNPWIGRPRAGTVEQPLPLPQHHVQQLAAHFDKQLNMNRLLEDPAVLASEDVAAVLRALCWENPKMTSVFIRGVFHVLQDNLLVDDDDGALDTLMSQAVDIVLSIKDSLFEARIDYLCQLPHSQQTPGLSLFLTCHDKPLLQLLCWWCICKLAPHHKVLEASFSMWMQDHFAVARTMFEESMQRSDVLEDEPLYQEDTVDKYKEVAVYIKSVLGR